MVENEPGQEIEEKQWVEIRGNSLYHPNSLEYGSVSWNPNAIYDGKNLEINVNALNNWIRMIGLQGKIRIEPLNQKPERDINIGSVNKNGEVVGSKSPIRSEKIKTHEIDFIRGQDPRIIRINFQGIAESLENKIDRKDNPDIYNKNYGKAIDKTVKKMLVPLATLNYIDTGNLPEEEQQIMTFDLVFKALPNATIATLGILFIVSDILQNKSISEVTMQTTSTLLTIADANSAISLFVYLLAKNEITKGEKGFYSKYFDYLSKKESGEKRSRPDYLARTFLPSYCIQHLVWPVICSATWQKPIFRGK